MKHQTLNRRQFLGRTAGITTAAAALGPLAPLPGWNARAAESAAARPKLSACIEALFTKLPFEQRLQAVKDAGLTAFEFWGWRGHDLDALAKKKNELGLTVAGFCTETGGDLVADNSKTPFVPALKESLAMAKKLDCRSLIVTTGNERPNVPRDTQRRNIVEALQAGAPLCAEAGVTLCLEPLNLLVDHKGYFLATSAESFQIIDEVGSLNVRLLFDIYHQQITEGHLTQNITKNIKKIGHFHVADVPGRHQPGTGEIRYAHLFRAIARLGYTGHLGLEMWPTIAPEEAVRQAAALFDDALQSL